MVQLIVLSVPTAVPHCLCGGRAILLCPPNGNRSLHLCEFFQKCIPLWKAMNRPIARKNRLNFW